MKKLFIIPVLLICMTSASSNRVRPTPIKLKQTRPALNTKVDSMNIKAKELNLLIRQQ
jgi:hypothetical protein